MFNKQNIENQHFLSLYEVKMDFFVEITRKSLELS